MIIKNIKYIVWFTFMFLSIGWLLPIRTYALETADIYGSENNGNLSYKNYINYKTSNGGLYTTTLGTVVSEANYGFSFYINKSATVGKVYKIRLNFNDYDYLHTNTYEVIRINSCTVTGYELKNIGSNTQAKTVDIMFQCISPVNFLTLSVGLNNQRITTVDWRLNSVQWEEIDTNADIIINNNQNTQNIINNQEQNTQDLIDNQNSIAEQQHEDQLVCNEYDKNSIVKKGYLWTDGSENAPTSSTYGITDYIRINEKSKITILVSSSEGLASCFYNQYEELISCFRTDNIPIDYEINIPTSTAYVRFSINKSANKPTFKVCNNSSLAITNELSDLNSNLTNDSPIDISSLSDPVGWLPPGPIDSIINLPLNMLNGLLTALNSSCTPLSVPVPFINQNVAIPCLSTIFGQITGLPDFWSWVGIIASVIILYRYLISLYDYYDRLTTLQANYLSDFGGAP